MTVLNEYEDSKYYALEIEKSDFLNAKKNIDKEFKGAVLQFMNSSAKMVFYKK